MTPLANLRVEDAMTRRVIRNAPHVRQHRDNNYA